MTPDDAPKAWDLLNLAASRGWGVAWVPQEDTNGAPYVTVRAWRGNKEIRASWHTRRPDGTTGKPRLFSALIGFPWRGATLTRIKEVIAA